MTKDAYHLSELIKPVQLLKEFQYESEKYSQIRLLLNSMHGNLGFPASLEKGLNFRFQTGRSCRPILTYKKRAQFHLNLSFTVRYVYKLSVVSCFTPVSSSRISFHSLWSVDFLLNLTFSIISVKRDCKCLYRRKLYWYWLSQVIGKLTHSRFWATHVSRK